MTEIRQQGSVGLATARKPRLVVAGAVGIVGQAADHLHRHGWEVVNVPAADAVRAALTRKPSALLLPDQTDIESGYLIAAKVREAKPRLKVVLVAPQRTVQAERFARFLGAGFVAETDAVSKLLRMLES
jgi:DNA-binding response OmpR family regulator